MKPSALVAIALAAAVVGCATKSVVYPELKGPPTVSVSKDTVSTMTETPAEDHLIPGSQVFVAGKGGAAKYFSLLGVAIDKARNEASVSGTEDALRMTFDRQLSDGLKNAASDTRASRPITLIDTGGDILMLPAARLVIRDDSKADLSFRVTVRFKDTASGNDGRKNYWYSYGSRPLAGQDGWTANQGALFKQASDEAMTRLAAIILDDLYGGYRQSLEPGQQRLVRWKPISGDQVVTAVLLREERDYLVVVPMFREKPMTSLVGAIPRSLIQMQP